MSQLWLVICSVLYSCPILLLAELGKLLAGGGMVVVYVFQACCSILISLSLLLFFIFPLIIAFQAYNLVFVMIYIDGNKQCLAPSFIQKISTTYYLSFDHVVSRNHLECKGRQWFPQGICINMCQANLYNFRSIQLDPRIHRHLVIQSMENCHYWGIVCIYCINDKIVLRHSIF